MRTTILTKALALSLLLAPMLAHSAGLGRLNVQSFLGQPLVAEFDLTSVAPDEASTLEVRLAGPDAYQRANLQYNPALNGVKLSIEKRASGAYYVRATTSRPVNEPFIDLVIELSSSAGRLVREYTALIDPPDFRSGTRAAAAPAVTPPVARPVTAQPAPAARAAAPATPAVSAKAQEYGPINQGETLGRIAASVKPAGVSLEQMMAGLFRANPDAFIRNNMNLVRTGKILRVPDAAEVSSIAQADAAREFHTHVSNWRAYSGAVADSAANTPEGGGTARGRIGRVDEGKGSDSKDVVRLSKGEPAKGKALGGAAAQEELVARNRELAEANDRIAQLEKTIKEMQKLLELKNPGLAAAAKGADKAPAKPAAEQKPAAKPADAPAKDAAKKAEAPADAKKDADAAAPAKDTAAAEKPKDAPKAEQKPAAKPKPKVVTPPPPPPPPEPDMVDMVMDNLPLIGGGLGALVVGGLGFAALRRRRAKAEVADEEMSEPVMPALGAAAAAAVAASSGATEAESRSVEADTPAGGSDEVDPIAEADVYIAYGRDAQAEEILKEAMAKHPEREDFQVKLAEIYSTRQDAAAFEGVAQSLNGLTGGAGDNWLRVAAMGYALDPSNALYESGKDLAPSAGAAEAAATDLDFDLGGDLAGDVGAPDIALDAGTPDLALDAGTPDLALDAGTPDFSLDDGSDAGLATQVTDLGALAAAADAGVPPAEPEPLMPDFNLDLPSSGADTPASDAVAEMPAAEPAAEPAASGMDSIDFNIELPAVDAQSAAAVETPAPAAASDDGGLDFKIDVGDLNINLDEPATQAVPAADKDGHWYDVQQKFDLAKAYQEMGDKDGAREILQEVLSEGDDQQKTEAQKVLDSLA